MDKTIFLTTYYMEEAEKLSDKVAAIVKGKLVAVINVDKLIAKHSVTNHMEGSIAT